MEYILTEQGILSRSKQELCDTLKRDNRVSAEVLRNFYNELKRKLNIEENINACKSIEIGDYVNGYECVGVDTIRSVCGWVVEIRYDVGGDFIKGYTIRCNDECNGARSNDILYRYGNITKLAYADTPY